MKRTRAVEILERLGISYELLEFEAERLTAEEAAELLHLPLEQVFKTLVVKADDGRLMLACVPATDELHLRAVARLIGARHVEMAGADDLMRLVGYIKGAVSPIGVKRPCPVYLDETALRYPRISVSAGVRGLQIWIDPRDLVRVVEAQTTPIARRSLSKRKNSLLA